MNKVTTAFNRIGFIFLIGTFLLVSKSFGEVPAEIYKMSEKIVYLQKVGHWQKGTLNGGFQVIVERQGVTKASHHLYVRWVCHCEQTKISILSILEQNGDETYVMTKPWYEFKENTSLLNYYRRNTQTDLWQQVQIQLTDIGEYHFLIRSVDFPEAELLAIR